MKIAILVLSFFIAIFTLPEPIYNIHYLRNYRKDKVNDNFGCNKGVVYGVYIYPTGPVDALYALMNSHIYGINAGCQRKVTYIKLFGESQDYSKLMDMNDRILDQIVSSISRGNTRNAIIDWKYLPENQQLQSKAFQVLDLLTKGLKKRQYNITIKAPASYFCKTVSPSINRFILDQEADSFIMELYGEEPGRYTTFESVFGQSSQQFPGYDKCSKYPTRISLKESFPDKVIFFQKTLDSTQPGFVGNKWEQFLQQAGDQQKNVPYFYDGFPLETVDF